MRRLEGLFAADSLQNSCQSGPDRTLFSTSSTATKQFSLHTPPFTLHPPPFSLHPPPFTLHPSHFTLHPPPFTSHSPPSSSTQSLSVSCHTASVWCKCRRHVATGISPVCQSQIKYSYGRKTAKIYFLSYFLCNFRIIHYLCRDSS